MIFATSKSASRLLALFCALLLSSCSSNVPSLEGDGRWSSVLNSPSKPVRSSNHTRRRASRIPFGNENARAAVFKGAFVQGNDKLTRTTPIDTINTPNDDGKKITLNLLKVPIAQAAKTILSDILKTNYTIDGRVQGKITIQTSRPVSRSALARTFISALKSNGASMLRQGDYYRIVPTEFVSSEVRTVSASNRKTQTLGERNLLIELKHVSAGEIQQVLTPLVPPSAIVRIDTVRNAIIVAGNPQELASIRETISIFDVDWMRGMSFALQPLQASNPVAIAKELDTIFQTKSGPLKGVIRFIPNKRLNAILVITSRSKYLSKANHWIKRLDKIAGKDKTQLHIYHVQNRTASELSKVLQSVYRTKGNKQISVETTVAPREKPISVNSPPSAAKSNQSTYTPAPARTSQNTAAKGPRIVADDSNNSLLIIASHDEYRQIRAVLRQIDAIPNQVLIEAVIAEVTLNDELKAGVRWFFGKKKHGVSFTDVATGAVASSFPGFSYFLSSQNVDVVLNAISSVTDVNIISSPSLMVLDNKTAKLQVGDQVPIVTQSANNVTAPGTPIVNKVELRDTGIILSVTPRVNDSGRVTLKIEQEVSSVVKTTTSGIDSPTIRQRKLSTTVVVNNGETLTLGGLIQERDTKGVKQIPVLGNIPLLGNLFKEKSDNIDRTELIIFIRPRVIRDLNEARQVTDEFRRRLSIKPPRANAGKKSIKRDIKRLLD